MEHTGRIWFGDDDRDDATGVSAAAESDDRIAFRVGEAWADGAAAIRLRVRLFNSGAGSEGQKGNG